VKSQLGIDRKEIAFDQVSLYFVDLSGLLFLLQCTERDAALSTKLAFNMMILPLSKQLTNLAGNLWSRTLAGGRAERNEYLLAHEFYNANYLVPDKVFANSANNAAKWKTKNQKTTTTSLQQKENAKENNNNNSNKMGQKNKKQTAQLDEVDEMDLAEEEGSPSSPLSSLSLSPSLFSR
jgi:DNA polymerase elongation subunit (family B)